MNFKQLYWAFQKQSIDIDEIQGKQDVLYIEYLLYFLLEDVPEWN
jgi:hypothetical protein